MTDSSGSASASDSTPQETSWRQIANLAGLALLIAVVLPFVIFAVPQLVGASQGYVVLSGSMEPVMSPGDAVIIEDVEPANIEEGDIITFGGGADSSPTTHRVIEVTQQDGTLAFRTEGDANEDPDSSLVTPSEIQGRVMSVGGQPFVIPYIGYVVNFASTQLGIVAFLAIPISLLVLNEIWNVIVAARPEQDSGGGATADAEAAVTQSKTSETENADADATVVDASAVDSGGAEAASAAVAADGTVAASGGEADTAEAESGDSGDAGVSFSAAELQLGLVVLAAFLIYSIWVAYSLFTTYDTVEIWAFGVAGGVGASFLLLAGLYFFGGSADADAGAPDMGPSESVPASDPSAEPDSSPEGTTEGSSTDDEDADPVVGGPERQLSDGGATTEDDENAREGSSDPEDGQ